MKIKRRMSRYANPNVRADELSEISIMKSQIS